jgi:hypothetical protein
MIIQDILIIMLIVYHVILLVLAINIFLLANYVKRTTRNLINFLEKIKKQ